MNIYQGDNNPAYYNNNITAGQQFTEIWHWSHFLIQIMEIE